MTILICPHCGQRCGQAARDGNRIEITMSRSAIGVRRSLALLRQAVPRDPPAAMALTCRRCNAVLELTAETARRVGTARRLVLR